MINKSNLIYFMVHVFLVAAASSNAADPAPFEGKPYSGNDAFADTWVATDGAGRRVPGFEECGPPREDHWVGIFYWTWHIWREGPHDNTKLLATAENGAVEWPENLASHHWGEPELGYYVMTDPFVIRKHASMLSDAGVDALFFDTTNPPFTWKEEYEALCSVYASMRAEGASTPAIAFIAPFGDPRPVLEKLWEDLYKPGLWRDLWFQWDGKPLILANKEYIENPEILDFFTFRRPMPDYWNGPSGPDQWSWLEAHPQHVFENSRGEAEQMSVGVAQNALPGVPGPAPMSHKRGAMGRSWRDGAKDPREGAVNWGLNFQKQWNRALEVDPQFVFVTGWNEWIAGRFLEWHIYTHEDAYYPGGLFVDQYNHEYSRDCEPMRGGHTDNYYYQLASNIRRFKGVRERPLASGPQEIAIDGLFGDWTEVRPEYRDTIGDTAHRDHKGYGDLVYTNNTGRNDFVIAKAAHDSNTLFYFIQTREAITPRTGPNWLLLLIDADMDTSTGWLGYDFAANLETHNDAESAVKAWRDGGWKTAGRATFRVNGNGMELSVPRDVLGMESGSPLFDFHWADNIQGFGDVSELGVNGDSAPNRRWNYRYECGTPGDADES